MAQQSRREMNDLAAKLPIAASKEQILSILKEHRRLVLVGDTGSGKTTQICQFLIDSGLAKSVAVTQPRRVAAISAAKRVAAERGVRVGGEVGYTVRFDDCSSPRTEIKYVTDGCLLRECMEDPLLSKYDAIILDEAHERSIHTDVLLALVKGVFQSRSDLTVLVTSATLDTDLFSQYMGIGTEILKVPGRVYPVRLFHTKNPDKDYVKATVDTVLTIHEHQGEGHVLCFLTGQEEIEKACAMLRRSVEDMLDAGLKVMDMDVVPLYAALPSESQYSVFAQSRRGVRKVVVATNIAETSLTVPGVVYVVDCGFVKQKWFDQKRGIESLSVTQISRVAAKQRAGRAGRTCPGQCYRLYSQATFESEMTSETVPEIMRVNLSGVVLYLKKIGILNPLAFDFLDKPDDEYIIEALKQLFALGAIDDDGSISILGERMAALPLEPNLSRAMLEAVQYGCADDVSTIVALLSTENVYFRPFSKEKRMEAEMKIVPLIQPSGDHMTLLHTYKEWERANYSQDWCSDHSVQQRSMRRAKDVRRQLIQILEKDKLSVQRSGSSDAILQALCAGYFMNTARANRKGGFRMFCEEGRLCELIPTSVLSDDDHIDCVMYHEVVWSHAGYLRTVSKIKFSWIEHLLPRLRGVNIRKLTGGELRKKRTADAVDDAPVAEGGAPGAQVVSKEDNTAKIESARERFLARKAARK